MPQPSVTEIRLKINYLNFFSNLPGANEIYHPCRRSGVGILKCLTCARAYEVELQKSFYLWPRWLDIRLLVAGNLLKWLKLVVSNHYVQNLSLHWLQTWHILIEMIQFLAELAQLQPFVGLEIAVVGGHPSLSGKLMNQLTSNVVYTLIVWFFRNYSILGCIGPISTWWLKNENWCTCS